MAQVETFSYKFPGMGKPDSFIVYPRKPGDMPGCYLVQGKRSILRVDLQTRRAVANVKGSNAKYFAHLSPLLGARPMDLEDHREFLALVREFAPDSGDLIGTSPETGPVYLA